MAYRILLSVAVACAACLEGLAAEPIQVPAGQRQLFLDDHGIARLENRKRTMHQPARRGAVIKLDQPWETALQTRCVPAWDEREKIFKIWLIVSTNASFTNVRVPRLHLGAPMSKSNTLPSGPTSAARPLFWRLRNFSGMFGYSG